MKNKISIIIVTYNNLKYTKDCIESIYKYTEKDTYEIIVIDNNSKDETKEWLKAQSNIKVIYNEENLGFPKACNQGIEISESENDILLLNNDTIVTKNWLENLSICLNSDSSIGAVGSVCNNNENDQGCDFIYDDFDTMQILAEKNNISDSNRWEEKVFLIGFCLLIKRKVLDKIGPLDDAYSPGYIEDNDLSLKIISTGYKLILCHDSFIHHYLGTAFRKDLDKFYPILYKNREYFINKWGFNTYAFDEVKNASLRIIESPKKILEFDCGIGTTILKLKYKDKNITIHGVEEDKSKRKISQCFTTVYDSLQSVNNNHYDCIFIGNRLEIEDNPKEFLKKVKQYLTDTGYIIGEISNIASIEQINSLLNDQWYDKHQNTKNNYTITDIKKLVEEDYNLNYIFSWYKTLSSEEKEIVEKLNKIKENNYEIVSYSFRCRKNINNL